MWAFVRTWSLRHKELQLPERALLPAPALKGKCAHLPQWTIPIQDLWKKREKKIMFTSLPHN